MDAPKKLEWPKMIYGPNGEEVVVPDAAARDAQILEWFPGEEPTFAVSEQPIRRGPGRPKKAA